MEPSTFSIPPDEPGCAALLAAIRWPNGFVCPHCEHTAAWRLPSRPRVWHCKTCKRHISVTAGTAMHGTKLPLRHWLVAATRLMRPGGVAAASLSRELGLRYESAWQLLHRLREWLGDKSAEAFAGQFQATAAHLPSRPPRGYRKHGWRYPDLVAVTAWSPDTEKVAARVLDGAGHRYLTAGRTRPKARSLELGSELRFEIGGTHRSVSPRWLARYLLPFEFRANGGSPGAVLARVLAAARRVWTAVAPPELEAMLYGYTPSRRAA